MAVGLEWDLEYGVDDVLRSQGADPKVIRARRPRLIALAERALVNGRDLVEPAVITRQLAVDGTRHNRVTLEGGFHLSGPLIVEHLGGAESVVVMLCTVGNRLGEMAAAESASNLSYGLALDAVGSAAVYALSAAACNQVEQDAVTAELQTSLPLSPGMEGWGVDPGQREIFSLIAAEQVGVVLSESLQMTPLKSMTTVIGVGAEIATKGNICDFCDLRDTCRHRSVAV